MNATQIRKYRAILRCAKRTFKGYRGSYRVPVSLEGVRATVVVRRPGLL
jgi:hypothetical protein